MLWRVVWPVFGRASGFTSPVAVNVRFARISPKVMGVYILVLVCSCHTLARICSAPVSLASGNRRRSPLTVIRLYFSTWAAHCGKVLGTFSSVVSVVFDVAAPDAVAEDCGGCMAGAVMMEWIPHWRLASSHI